MPAPTAPSKAPPAPSKPPSAAPASPRKFTTSSGVKKKGQCVVVYGTGGVGKTSLCALAGKSVRFIDINSGGTAAMNVSRVEGIKTFQDILDALRTPSLWEGVDTIVIDSATDLGELAVDWTLANVKTEKGLVAKSINGYGWNTGYSHVYETFHQVLAALDRHVEEGRNIILICHSEVAKAPNPAGEDFTQHQPALQMSNKGNIRSRVQGWCDHLLYIGYDVSVADGKAKGEGTRTIQVNERPAYWAKSRTLRNPIDFPDPVADPAGAAEVWRQIGIVPAL